MQGKDTTKSTFIHLLTAVDQQRDYLNQQGVDRYAKNFIPTNSPNATTRSVPLSHFAPKDATT